MTKLSANINKFATLRNSRVGNNPDVLQATIDAHRFSADGITVHPRRMKDIYGTMMCGK